MKQKEIQVGRLYQAKVSGVVRVVRILRIRRTPEGQWRADAENLTTGRKVVIKSPQRLRREVKP